MSEPYFYETAGGAGSDLPTATFFWESFGAVNTIELNPRQWLASNGPCASVGAGQLCYMQGQDMMLDVVFGMIRDTLVVSPAGMQAETTLPVDLGGMSPQEFMTRLGVN